MEQPENKMNSPNKALEAIGAKARLSLNPDVGTKEMNIRYIAALLWMLCVVGYATPPPTAPITKEKALADYDDRYAWAEKMLVNIANAGFFSSDRTIRQYNEDIWHL